MSVRIEVVEDPATTCAEMMLEPRSRGRPPGALRRLDPRRAYELAAGDPGAWSGANLSVRRRALRSARMTSARTSGMFKEALLDRIGEHAAGAVVHRIQGELGPDAAADAYEQRAARRRPAAVSTSCCWGSGPTATPPRCSPTSPPLQERSRLVVGVPQAGLEPFVPRVTLTLPALAAAQRIVFLVAGEAKAEIVARVFGPEAEPDPHLPSIAACAP